MFQRCRVLARCPACSSALVSPAAVCPWSEVGVGWGWGWGAAPCTGCRAPWGTPTTRTRRSPGGSPTWSVHTLDILLTIYSVHTAEIRCWCCSQSIILKSNLILARYHLFTIAVQVRDIICGSEHEWISGYPSSFAGFIACSQNYPKKLQFWAYFFHFSTNDISSKWYPPMSVAAGEVLMENSRISGLSWSYSNQSPQQAAVCIFAAVCINCTHTNYAKLLPQHRPSCCHNRSSHSHFNNNVAESNLICTVYRVLI